MSDSNKDLRTLSVAELNQALSKLGFDQQTIDGLNRWEKINLIIDANGQPQEDDTNEQQQEEVPHVLNVAELDQALINAGLDQQTINGLKRWQKVKLLRDAKQKNAQ